MNGILQVSILLFNLIGGTLFTIGWPFNNWPQSVERRFELKAYIFVNLQKDKTDVKCFANTG